MRSAFLLGCVLAAVQPACTIDDFFKGVTAFAQGSQYLGTLIDIADGGQRAYFNRHPSLELEPRVQEKIFEARQALAAMDAALAAAERAGEGDVIGARNKALEAYEALYNLLHELGIPQAKPASGGPETDAPEPKPFELPTPEIVAILLTS
jgi:hypothetical protein